MCIMCIMMVTFYVQQWFLISGSSDVAKLYCEVIFYVDMYQSTRCITQCLYNTLYFNFHIDSKHRIQHMVAEEGHMILMKDEGNPATLFS